MSRVVQGTNGITQAYKPGVHNGVDIGWKGGDNDNILVHSAGVVVEVVKNINWTKMGSGSYGNYVKILHDNGYYTLYAHMEYNSVCVNKGDKVIKGQKIGYMGNTGQSNGKHLHFEVRTPSDVRINPTPYINADLPEVNAYETFILGVQSTCGAKVDSKAGPETLSKTPTISKTQNNRHPVVKILQEYFVYLGYNVGKYGKDGIIGDDMEKVIKQYQADHSCTVDGEITARQLTWQKLLGLK